MRRDEAAGEAQREAIHRTAHLALVGHRQLRRIGWRRRAHVGDEVAQRDVALVSHSRDRGNLHRGEGAAHLLLIERAQVLARAPAATHDAHVGVEQVDRAQRAHQFGHRIAALHPGADHQDPHRRPSAPRDRDDVVQRRALEARHHGEGRG